MSMTIFLENQSEDDSRLHKASNTQSK